MFWLSLQCKTIFPRIIYLIDMKNCYQAFSPPVTAARKLSYIGCWQLVSLSGAHNERTVRQDECPVQKYLINELSSCLQVILHRTKDTKRTPSEQSKELTKKIAAERISVFIFFKAKVPIKFYGHIFHMLKFFVLQKYYITFLSW